MESFKTEISMMKWLEKNRFKIFDAKDEELGQYVATIIGSPLLDDHRFMMEIKKWVEMKLHIKFVKLIRHSFKYLYDVDLSLYKFAIITGYRGPFEIGQFEDWLSDNLYQNVDPYFETIFKHKDFPAGVKQKLYELTNDVEYLPKEAQDIFVF